MRAKLAAVLALNQAKKAGYAGPKVPPAMNARKKKTEKLEKPVDVQPNGNDNTKKASDRSAAKDLGFLKAALDLGLSGKALDEFYIAAQRKLAADNMNYGTEAGQDAVTARNAYTQRASSVGKPATPAKPATAPADPFAGYGLPNSATAPVKR
jgi:hypothetical protein